MGNLQTGPYSPSLMVKKRKSSRKGEEDRILKGGDDSIQNNNIDEDSRTGSPSASSVAVEGLKDPDNRPTLTAEQIETLVRTWKLLNEDIAKVGVVTFMGLFETHPDTLQVFLPFRDLTGDDLRHSAQLRAHSLRVMQTVEKTLARINDEPKLIRFLHELGTLHCMSNAKGGYMELMGPAFIQAVKPSLEEQWSDDVEQAWLMLFQLMAHVMQEVMPC